MPATTSRNRRPATAETTSQLRLEQARILVFPVNSTLGPLDSALIRSASGNDYTYLYRQDAIEIPEVPASGDFVVSTQFTWTDISAGSGVCRQRNAPAVSCSAGVYTFSVGDSISPTALFGGTSDASSTTIPNVVADGKYRQYWAVRRQTCSNNSGNRPCVGI